MRYTRNPVIINRRNSAASPLSMKLLRHFTIFAFAACSLLAGCVNNPPAPLAFQQEVDNRLDVQSEPAVAMLHGQPAFAYVTPDSHVVFEYDGNRVRLDQGLHTKGGKFLQLHVRGDDVLVSWWNHEPNKALYFTRSTDGGKKFSAPTVVNTGHGVLAPFTFAFGRDGHVGMAYSDERVPNYSVFFNRSDDLGANWVRPDQRIDPAPGPDEPSLAHEPQLAAIGPRWVVVWRDAGGASQSGVERILARSSTDDGRTWSAAKVIYTSHGVMSGQELKSVDGHLVLVYAEDDHVSMMLGDADGVFGAPIRVPGPETNFSGGFHIAGDGHSIVIVWNTIIERAKPIVMAASFDPASGHWIVGSKRLDVGKPDNTMSLDPQVVATADGAYVATWVDFRNIVPNVYVSASVDRGAHWSAPRNAGIDGADFMTNPQLVEDGHNALLTYEYSPGTDRSKLLFTYKKLGVDAKGEIVGLPVQHVYTQQEKKNKLIERVRGFWKLRSEAKFADTYRYFDPAMRSAISAQEFDKGQAQIAYWDVKDLRTNIDGNVATVLVNAHLKVQPMMVQGRKIDIPERTTDIKATWVWVKDNWYVVFTGFRNQTYLTY